MRKNKTLRIITISLLTILSLSTLNGCKLFQKVKEKQEEKAKEETTQVTEPTKTEEVSDPKLEGLLNDMEKSLGSDTESDFNELEAL
jgi:hypothetical protein